MPIECLIRPGMRRATWMEADWLRALTLPLGVPATHMSNVLQCHLLQGKSTVSKSNEGSNAHKAAWAWWSLWYRRAMCRQHSSRISHCDTDMQCADNTAAELAVVIAAAIVKNAQSYSNSFSVQINNNNNSNSNNKDTECQSGCFLKLQSGCFSELQQSFRSQQH